VVQLMVLSGYDTVKRRGRLPMFQKAQAASVFRV